MSKLTFREKAGFSAGEFGGSGLWQVMMIFLPAFYTDIFGIPAATVGTLFLIVRVMDAFFDPVMGVIADRTTHRHGRFRPYVLWGALPFALLSFALFYGPELAPTGKVVYAYTTYILMMAVYTVVMIPFSALSGVMTADYHERTSLNSFRFISAFAAAMAVQGLVRPSVAYLGGGDEALGYRLTFALFGLLALLGFVITFRSTREHVKPVEETSGSIWSDLRDLSRNRPWLVILSVSLLTLVYISIRSAVQLYYFKYYMGDEALVSTFMVSGTAATLVAIFLTERLTRLLDKKRLYMVCMTVVGFSALPLYWLKPDQIPLIFACQILFSFASGPTMPLLWSMMGDIADYSEWKNGRRATGLVFSATVFAQKAGGALGGAIAMFILSLYHYQPNVAQTPEVLQGILAMLSLYPALGAVLCAAILAFYPIDAGLMQRIATDLKARVSRSSS